MNPIISKSNLTLVQNICASFLQLHTYIAPYTKEVPWQTHNSGGLIQVCNVKVWQINILSSRRFEVEDATIEG